MPQTFAQRGRALARAIALLALGGLTLTGSGLPAAAAAPTAPPDALPESEIIRIHGEDRYGTAAEISKRWSPGVAGVLIASGERHTDAIAAATLAGRENVPVLLTRSDRLPPETVTALRRLEPDRIVIVGGTAVVAESVAEQLASLTSGPVERRAGGNSYATAAAVAATYPAGSERVYVARGDDFADALTGSAAAGFHDSPLLLTRPQSLPAETAEQLERLAPSEIVILGGPVAITDNVAQDAADAAGLTSWRRLGGSDRYGTAAEVANELPDRGAVWIASGRDFADSVVGSALAAWRAGPVLLVSEASVPQPTWQVLDDRQPQWISVLGGPRAIPEPTVTELAGRPASQGSSVPNAPPTTVARDEVPGWTLQYATDFATLDGWVARDETQDNDNSRNIPENVVTGRSGLIIHARREAGYNRPYTSGEIHGTGDAVVPNYFRAEVVAEVMDEDGLWPAALWFRPVGHSDGEIDVMEYMGGREENQQRKRFAVTMHNEYGESQASLKAPIHIDDLSRRTVTGVHRYTIEKTPGQIKVWIDDDIEHASVFTADEADWWDRIMEVEGREWYPRITLQVGSGSRKAVVPEPARSWQHSSMTVHSVRLWSMD